MQQRAQNMSWETRQRSAFGCSPAKMAERRRVRSGFRFPSQPPRSSDRFFSPCFPNAATDLTRSALDGPSQYLVLAGAVITRRADSGSPFLRAAGTRGRTRHARDFQRCDGRRPYRLSPRADVWTPGRRLTCSLARETSVMSASARRPKKIHWWGRAREPQIFRSVSHVFFNPHAGFF